MATAKGRSGKLTPTQARRARRERQKRRRRVLRTAIGIGIGTIALLFVVSLFAGGIPTGNVGRAAPDGPGERIDELPRAPHLVTGEETTYNSVPATSGLHYGSPWRWGVYDEIVDERFLVHNLEHGGIRVHYDCPNECPDLVNQLTDLVEQFPSAKIVLSPYPNMNNTIALAAWTFLDMFETFDEQRIRDFIAAHESSPNSPEPLAR